MCPSSKQREGTVTDRLSRKQDRLVEDVALLADAVQVLLAADD